MCSDVGSRDYSPGVDWFDFEDYGSLGLPIGLCSAPSGFYLLGAPIPDLKVNFDGSVMGTFGGTGFVIRGPKSRLVAVGGSHLFCPSILEAKLRATWAGIIYTRHLLWANRLIIEGDSSTIMGWIQSSIGGPVTHPLLQDI